METADIVRNMRKATPFTQEELGRRAGLPRTEINRIENGANQATSRRVRKGLAKAFGLPVGTVIEALEGRMPVKSVVALIKDGAASSAS